LTSPMLLAILLQAAGTVAEGAEGAQSAVPVTIERTGLLHLILDASLLAQIVILVLLVFSVYSWAIAFSKYGLLNKAVQKNNSFLKTFRRLGQLAELNAASEEYRPAPLVTVFEFGYEEVARQVNSHGKLRNGAALERCLQLGISEEIARLNRNMGWLATTASAAPFIGLFGTVWGIMVAFNEIGATGSTSITAVAPGIAEALVNTAAGLVAAIPALVGFNFFGARLRGMRAQMQDFILEFMNLTERNFT